MKTVIQLDQQSYYMGSTVADESPLEPGIYLMPAGTIDAEQPIIPKNHRARWVDNSWTFESLPIIVSAESSIIGQTYVEKRAMEYPTFADQLDLIYHGGIEAWKAAIQAVKDKYPKG